MKKKQFKIHRTGGGDDSGMPAACLPVAEMPPNWEPDLSVPPATAEEYLLRVRWEATRKCQQVVVASNIDPRQYDANRTPQLERIFRTHGQSLEQLAQETTARIPKHRRPWSEEWRNQFLYDFAEKRQWLARAGIERSKNKDSNNNNNNNNITIYGYSSSAAAAAGGGGGGGGGVDDDNNNNNKTTNHAEVVVPSVKDHAAWRRALAFSTATTTTTTTTTGGGGGGGGGGEGAHNILVLLPTTSILLALDQVAVNELLQLFIQWIIEEEQEQEQQQQKKKRRMRKPQQQQQQQQETSTTTTTSARAANMRLRFSWIYSLLLRLDKAPIVPDTSAAFTDLIRWALHARCARCNRDRDGDGEKDKEDADEDVEEDDDEEQKTIIAHINIVLTILGAYFNQISGASLASII